MDDDLGEKETRLQNSEPKGPRAWTQDDKTRIANEICSLEEERAKLQEEYTNHFQVREAEMKELKRVSAECRGQIEEIKSSGSARLQALMKEHESARSTDAQRIAGYLAKAAEDSKRIQALQKELASLKAEVASVCAAESLPAFMRRLKLDAHLTALEEEELDVSLLRSMGREELESNMAQLGLSVAEAIRMADDLFAVP